MARNTAKIFEECTLPHDLCDKVLFRVSTKSVRKAKNKTFLSVLAGFLSGVALIPEVIWAYKDTLTSGFAQSFSLVFSDSSLIVTYWKEFTYSLVESMPIISFSISLATVLVLLISLRTYFKSKSDRIIFSNS